MESKSIFDFPAEIRLRIYGSLLPSSYRDKNFPSALDNLRLTNRTIKKELDHEIIQDMCIVPSNIKARIFDIQDGKASTLSGQAAAYHLNDINIQTNTESTNPFSGSKHLKIFININDGLEIGYPPSSTGFDDSLLQVLLNLTPTHVQHISFYFTSDPHADLARQDLVLDQYMAWTTYLIDIITTGHGLKVPRTPLRIETFCDGLTDNPQMMQVFEMMHQGVDHKLSEIDEAILRSRVIRNSSNQATQLAIDILGDVKPDFWATFG